MKLATGSGVFIFYSCSDLLSPKRLKVIKNMVTKFLDIGRDMINIYYSKRLLGHYYVTYLIKYNNHVEKLLLSHLDLKSRKYLVIFKKHGEMQQTI